MSPDRREFGGVDTGDALPRFRMQIGFVLVVAGGAVGLGNMWRFPYMVAENGGAAFLWVYAAMTLALGVPFVVAEILMGRRAGARPPQLSGRSEVGRGGGWGCSSW